MEWNQNVAKKHYERENQEIKESKLDVRPNGGNCREEIIAKEGKHLRKELYKEIPTLIDMQKDVNVQIVTEEDQTKMKGASWH